MALGADDKARAAVTYGYLLVIGGITLAAAILVPGHEEQEPGLLVALAGVLLVLGLAMVRYADAAPAWSLHAVIVTAIASNGLIIALSAPDVAGAMSVGFVLVVLAAFYYFDLRVAAAYAILAAGCYGLVMLSDDEIPARGVKFVIGVGALSAVAMIMVRLRRRTRALLGELDLAAHTDALTGLSNRRAFEERFEYEIARAERAGRPLGLVLIDIDGFKGLNDRLGHEEGDRALVRLAELLRSSIRRIDMASRLGGEEFAVIAPEAGADEALTLAERIRMGAVRRVGPPGEVSTVSCGVAAYPDLGRSEQELLRSADQALYAAKRGGRNRSEVGVIRPQFGNQEDDDDEQPDDASAGSIKPG